MMTISQITCLMMTRLLCFSLILCFLSCVVFAARDYYKILEVSKPSGNTDAWKKELKRNFRRLSLKHHPDKSDDPNAAQIFADIAEVYDVLNDDDLRRIYDERGEEGLKRHKEGGGGGGGHNPFDFFNDIFGGFGGFGGGGRRGSDEKPRTPTVTHRLQVSLEQLFEGDELTVKFTRLAHCADADKCLLNRPACQGPGIAVQRQQLGPGFIVQNQVNDPACISAGKGWKECSECPEGPLSKEAVSHSLFIPAGAKNGDKLTIHGMADAQAGFDSGDVEFIIEELPHDLYLRDGDDLHITISVPLVDALVGIKKSFIHLDREEVVIESASMVRPGQVFTIIQRGVYRKTKGRGNLYVKIDVEFPAEEMSDSQKKQVKSVLGASSNQQVSIAKASHSEQKRIYEKNRKSGDNDQQQQGRRQQQQQQQQQQGFSFPFFF